MAYFGMFNGIAVRAIAAAVPETRVENVAYLLSIGEEQVSKFERMTGVKERRHAMKLTTRDLACRAAEALKAAGAVSAEDIDVLIFVSQTPDARLPASACVLQEQLGLRADAAAYDVGLGCSGFVYGLWQAASLCASGAAKRVLLTGGDTISRIAAKDDFQNQMLFGDAGFAAVVEADEFAGHPLCWQLGSNGAGANVIRCEHGGVLQMDGLEVFNFTTSVIPTALKEFSQNSGQPLSEFGSFCFHQANRFILTQIAMMAGFSARKHLISIDRFGNTSSASIPLTLCDQREKRPGKTLCAGFGVGLSWGIVSYDFSNTLLLPVQSIKE